MWDAEGLMSAPRACLVACVVGEVAAPARNKRDENGEGPNGHRHSATGEELLDRRGWWAWV